MSPYVVGPTREIARAAVRESLSQAAFELVRARGFQNVTLDDMAAAAGVSRSTLLRYFGTKEDVLLSAFDAHVARFADALRARPDDEDDWSALHAVMGQVIAYYLDNPRGALRMTKLIVDTPELAGRQLEKMHGWRPALTRALADRRNITGPLPVALAVRAAAALSCLTVAVERWSASDGTEDLADLLRQGFEALGPATRGA
ncbi:MAG: TetR family transcriptional regulator [Gordonia sp. (in: high G+C Gram-positive bacteria)]